MKFDESIIDMMIREYFVRKTGYDDWYKYPIKINSYQVEDKVPGTHPDHSTIFVWYSISIMSDSGWSTNCVRLDKEEYLYRLSNKESSDRDKKINNILNRSFLDKIKNKIWRKNMY